MIVTVSPPIDVSSSDSSSDTTSRINKVVVVGGTHGNEYTGVWCIKALDRQGERLKSKFPTLDISTIMGNPQAHMANKRFIEEDLNRQFSAELLSKPPTSLEARRAHELNELLGPKPLTEQDSPSKTDVIIDMHSTTANMGMTLIVPEGDVLMTQAAAYAVKKCKLTQSVCLISTYKPQAEKSSLYSIAKHGFTIEVGPVPQGVIRHDAVEQTQEVLNTLFEFLHLYNEQPAKLRRRLYDFYPSGEVPCYRSALASRHGEVAGKISWPCIGDNPNFPTYMIHKSLQDNDYMMLRKGDPLFVDLDGNIIPYDGSHGSPIRVTFINEGGYYYASSGTGISVAIPASYDLRSGFLVDEDDETDASMTDDASSSSSSS